MTPAERAQFEAAISEVANATQVLAAVATQVRQSLGTVSEDAVRLEAAAGRVVNAVRRLQPRAE